MWLIASIVVFFVYMAVFGVSGWIVGWWANRISGDRLAKLMRPGKWSAFGLLAALVLATMVDPIARAGLPSIFGSKFLAWWALACLAVGFGFSLAFSGARERSRERDTLEHPRLAVDPSLNAKRLRYVYGQDSWHSPAHIVGSRDALASLEAAVHRALSEPAGVGATSQVWLSDDEGYRVVVVRADNEGFFEGLPSPYVGDSAFGSTPQGEVRMPITSELSESIAAAVREADERETAGSGLG